MSNKEKNLNKLTQDQKGKTAGGHCIHSEERKVHCPQCGHWFLWSPSEPLLCPKCKGLMV